MLITLGIFLFVVGILLKLLDITLGLGVDILRLGFYLLIIGVILDVVLGLFGVRTWRSFSRRR